MRPVQAGLQPPTHPSWGQALLMGAHPWERARTVWPTRGEQGGSSCTISGVRLHSTHETLQVWRLTQAPGRCPLSLWYLSSEKLKGILTDGFISAPQVHSEKGARITTRLGVGDRTTLISQIEKWRYRASSTSPQVS